VAGRWLRGYVPGMTDNSVDPQDEQDQDSEPTMTAPAEGRPDGSVQEPDAIGHDGLHAQDADDQQGAESTD
jgi:hypothetical protein